LNGHREKYKIAAIPKRQVSQKTDINIFIGALEGFLTRFFTITPQECTILEINNIVTHSIDSLT
jgi:hypothetical protein